MAYFLKTATARGKRPVFLRRAYGNKGAIVGTATKTTDGTTHAVLLYDPEIERRLADQPIGSYSPINIQPPYPQNIVVTGQLMDLKLVDTTNTLPITNIRWVIDGTTFRNYAADSSTGTLTQLVATDLNNSNGTATVQFFWADPGQKKVVCKFNVGLTQTQVSYTFTVVAPTNTTLNLPVTRGTVAVKPPGFDDQNPTLWDLASFNTESSSGIKYTVGYNPVSSSDTAYPIEVQIFQLWTPGRTYLDKTTNQAMQLTLAGKIVPVIDGGVPYYSNHTFHITSSSPISAADAPQDEFAGNDDDESVNDQFDVWIMCRSLQPLPGQSESSVNTTNDNTVTATVSSTWVPLAHFQWSWSGEAELSGPNYVLVPGSGASPQPNPSQATTTFPQWTASNGDVSYTPQ